MSDVVFVVISSYNERSTVFASPVYKTREEADNRVRELDDEDLRTGGWNVVDDHTVAEVKLG